MTDTLLQYLLNGDLLGFITACFTIQIGQSFYAIIGMIMTMTLYIRTQSLMLVSLVWVTLGGFLMSAVPMVGPVALLFLSLGVAGMLYKLYTTIS